MPIRKRGKIWWVDVSTPDGKRIRCSAGTEDKVKAQEYHDKIKHEAWAVAKLEAMPEKIFDDIMILALRDAEDQSCFENKQIYARYWMGVFGGRQIAGIRGEEIANNLPTHSVAKRVKLSSATRNRYRSFITRAFSLAVKAGWLNKVPFVQSQREPKVRIRWIEKEQARALVSSLSLDWMKRIVAFALLTGARKGEIFSLKWAKVNLTRRIAVITADNAKSGKARPLPLNNEAVRILNECSKDSEYVFAVNGEKLKEINRNDFARALEISGITDFRFHDLRHTWASWHVQDGTPLMTLKEMGGWESIEMVQRYAHLAPNHLTQHAMQIDSFLAGNGTNMAQGAFAELVNIA